MPLAYSHIAKTFGISKVKTAKIAVTNTKTPYLTLIINIFVSSYEYKEGKKLNSYILISDSVHTKSDIFVSIGVLATLIGVKLGLPPIIDPINKPDITSNLLCP